MARVTKQRKDSLDHTSIFTDAGVNSEGEIILSSSGGVWELDILTSISVPNPTPSSGPYVVSLNTATSEGNVSVIKMSGVPSLDASGDKRLFVFINGVELNASALGSTSNSDEIQITLDYQLDATSDTIKVWYSV